MRRTARLILEQAANNAADRIVAGESSSSSLTVGELLELPNMSNAATLRSWDVKRLDDLTGKQYFITGGNSGIGFEAAAHLRRANADVLIGSRDLKRGDEAVERLGSIDSNGEIAVIELDLANLDSIQSASDAIRDHTDGLDAVINNAGIMQPPKQATADGFELQFGTNHLGHFMLNYLTFDLITARAGRIVPVSSIVHLQSRGINFDDPMFTKNYSPTIAYSQSKLANLMYGLELARRLEAAGSGVIAVSCHPGYSATNLQSTGPTGMFELLYRFTNPLIAQSAIDGAVPEVLAAAGSEAVNGAYYGPTWFGDMRGPVGDSRISRLAKSTKAGSRLWTLSEDLLGITWDVS